MPDKLLIDTGIQNVKIDRVHGKFMLFIHDFQFCALLFAQTTERRNHDGCGLGAAWVWVLGGVRRC